MILMLAILLFAARTISLNSGAAQWDWAGQRASPSNSAQPAPYLRVTRSDSNLVQLQIAVRKFVPARRSAPIIWLSGASHIGESNYFGGLQKHLDDQTLVLFEGIRDRHQKDSSSASARPTENVVTEANPSDAGPSLQMTLAESLGLIFQLKAIDYQRPHFRNSDLSIQQLQHLMQEKQKGLASGTGGNVNKQFETLMEIMDERSLLGALAKIVVNVLGSSPKLQAITKLALIETLGQLKGDVSQLKGLPPEMSELVKVLIQARNQAVVDDLKAELQKKARPRSIAVFYGAGHMEDLEKRLRSELKYRPAEEFWLTAFSVDLEKAGVTDAEVQLIRSLTKWQMDQLQR